MRIREVPQGLQYRRRQQKRQQQPGNQARSIADSISWPNGLNNSRQLIWRRQTTAEEVEKWKPWSARPLTSAQTLLAHKSAYVSSHLDALAQVLTSVGHK